jgi:acyl carrier protein
VSQARLNADEVRAVVNSILVEEFEVEESALEPSKPLADLGLDSLDGVDLVVALEKAFRVRIPEQEARSIRTLADIYARVLARQDAAGSPS